MVENLKWYTQFGQKISNILIFDINNYPASMRKLIGEKKNALINADQSDGSFACGHTCSPPFTPGKTVGGLSVKMDEILLNAMQAMCLEYNRQVRLGKDRHISSYATCDKDIVKCWCW